jgi:hypothetical protein
MNKTLYRLIGSTFGSKLKKKLASRCVRISTRNCIKSLENFITDTSWAFEGMKMNSSSSSQGEEDFFETFPLPFSNFRLKVIKRSSFNQPSAAMSTLLDRYASSIQRLWIDKFWCCLPAESGEKAFYSKLCSLTDLTIRQAYSKKGSKNITTTTETIQDWFPENLTKNLKSLVVKSEDIGKEDNASIVMEWMSRSESLQRFRIPEMLYVYASDTEEDEEYCHNEDTLLWRFLSACLAREQLGFPVLNYLDLAGLTWNDGSIEDCTEDVWVSFQKWILKNISDPEHPKLFLENIECGFFSLVSPSPGHRVARRIAEVVLSLNSINHKVMELVFPRVNTLNLLSGDDEWTTDGQEPGTALVYQQQNLWPNLEAVNIYFDRLVKPRGVRCS